MHGNYGSVSYASHAKGRIGRADDRPIQAVGQRGHRVEGNLRGFLLAGDFLDGPEACLGAVRQRRKVEELHIVLAHGHLDRAAFDSRGEFLRAADPLLRDLADDALTCEHKAKLIKHDKRKYKSHTQKQVTHKQVKIKNAT